MSAAATSAVGVHGRLGGRLWGIVAAAWAVVTGLAPHVLHHFGPLAGAALLGGFGGKAIFFALGLVVSVPILRRLCQRFGTLVAPALAVVAFAVVFTFFSLVIAPRLTGPDASPPTTRSIDQPSGHESHHAGGGK